MNTTTLQIILSFISALAVANSIVPLFMRLAPRLGLIDKPNARKIHIKPTPLIGGVIVLIGSIVGIALSSLGIQAVVEHAVPIAATLIIFGIAVWDDRADLSPKLRLLVQLLSATAVVVSGIRIESLHGIFGIEELPIILQYVLTILVIAGVTNAFNLVDGIDGLAGGLAFINMSVLAVLAFVVGQTGLGIMFISMVGALIAFLRFNRNPAKIFMGDGGSMMLGFFMAVMGVRMIQAAEQAMMLPATTMLIVVGMLLLPVMDALRVFALRYVLGLSIFTPDKSHLHHLILMLGLNHRKVSRMIVVFQILIILSAVVLGSYVSPTVALLLLVAGMLLFSKVLTFNKRMIDWQLKIQNNEQKSAVS